MSFIHVRELRGIGWRKGGKEAKKERRWKGGKESGPESSCGARYEKLFHYGGFFFILGVAFIYVCYNFVAVICCL